MKRNKLRAELIKKVDDELYSRIIVTIGVKYPNNWDEIISSIVDKIEDVIDQEYSGSYDGHYADLLPVGMCAWFESLQTK